MPKITNPETNDAIDLWSRRIGTVSIRELIFGTTKGATIDADSTAMIASFFNMDLESLVTFATLIINFDIHAIYLSRYFKSLCMDMTNLYNDWFNSLP